MGQLVWVNTMAGVNCGPGLLQRCRIMGATEAGWCELYLRARIFLCQGSEG